MQPFQLTLSNNGTVAGLQSIPPLSAQKAPRMQYSPTRQNTWEWHRNIDYHSLRRGGQQSLSALSADNRPLIVGLHGGGYDSQYFDATPKYSASTRQRGRILGSGIEILTIIASAVEANNQGTVVGRQFQVSCLIISQEVY
jgi:hypothetical protein